MMCSGKPLFLAIVGILCHSHLIAWHVVGMEIILLI